MNLKRNVWADWPGGRGVFKVEAGNRGGQATLQYRERWENGNVVDRGIVAVVQVPGEHTISLSAGELLLDVTDPRGRELACTASFEPAPKARKTLTLEQRVRAIEAKSA